MYLVMLYKSNGLYKEDENTKLFSLSLDANSYAFNLNCKLAKENNTEVGNLDNYYDVIYVIVEA